MKCHKNESVKMLKNRMLMFTSCFFVIDVMKNVKELVSKKKQDEKMIYVINYMFAITIMLLVGTHMLGILNISTYI